MSSFAFLSSAIVSVSVTVSVSVAVAVTVSVAVVVVCGSADAGCDLGCSDNLRTQPDFQLILKLIDEKVGSAIEQCLLICLWLVIFSNVISQIDTICASPFLRDCCTARFNEERATLLFSSSMRIAVNLMIVLR